MNKNQFLQVTPHSRPAKVCGSMDDDNSRKSTLGVIERKVRCVAFLAQLMERWTIRDIRQHRLTRSSANEETVAPLARSYGIKRKEKSPLDLALLGISSLSQTSKGGKRLTLKQPLLFSHLKGMTYQVVPLCCYFYLLIFLTHRYHLIVYHNIFNIILSDLGRRVIKFIFTQIRSDGIQTCPQFSSIAPNTCPIICNSLSYKNTYKIIWNPVSRNAQLFTLKDINERNHS